ncbi:MAG: NAD(+) synthase [bacterium]|nr:NAD(+) synthase [bacterium]
MTKDKRIKLPTMDPRVVADEIGDFIVCTVLKSNKTGAIVGLSGGVDSTVTAALAKMAFDKHNIVRNRHQHLELVGYILPSKINSEEDSYDGVEVAKKLGIRYQVYDIQPHVVPYENMLNPKNKDYPFDKGNVISRVRANILSTMAALEDKVLLGTGNKDEDFGIGYYTLFGDGAVHCSPLGGLSKRLVCEMAQFVEFGDIAKKTPSAGLELGQTDFKDIGYSYDVVELLTEARAQGWTTIKKMLNHSQIQELVWKDIDNYQAIFGKRKLCAPEIVIEDFLKRNKSAKAKARIIHPPIAKVTLKYK